jgi:hypothetical protein
MKIARLFIITLLLAGSLPAQGEFKQETYWIYTYSKELKDYQINAIEGDNLVINNGDWDVNVPLDEVEMILKPPGPSPLGQILGGAIGGYGGICVGFIAGSIIFGTLLGGGSQEGMLAVTITSLLAGAYYGSKVGGGILKGEPEIIADLGFMTLAEKKEYIQTNLIY